MRYIITLLFILITSFSFGQDYKNSAGLRFGRTKGVNYKRFLNASGAVELFLGFDGHDEGIQLYTTYQWHEQIPTPFTESLYLYYGVGGHIGYVRPTTDKTYYENGSSIVTETQKRTYYAIGVDGIVGLEYRIYTVPMTVSLEVKPYFEYYGLRYTQVRFWDFGFTVKYIF
jgi:hypothetical protein